MLFVHLYKAYDSVPRVALWCALQKYGVPDVMIELIRSLHDGMSATVTVGGRVGERTTARSQALLYCKHACLQVMLLWCAPAERILFWLPGYLMK